MGRLWRMSVVVAAAAAVWACGRTSETGIEVLPTWTFDSSMIFPAERGLTRPEDGVALADGRLIVADQATGLREIAADGSTRPFGRFAEAGYVHELPERAGGASGVSLEPDGTHVLVADVLTGSIYRVSLETEDTEVIYTHPFGVNVARRDRTGAIWFTQSTENTPGADSETRLFAALDVPVADGALFRIAPTPPEEPLPAPQRAVSGLYFPNGFVIDEETGHLYLAETTRDRVSAFHVGAATGELSDRRVIADVMTPDNVELDEAGRAWIVSPGRNEIVVVEPHSGIRKAVFRAASPDNDRISAEWQRRGEAGEPRLDLMSPEGWSPLPGALTGVILTPGDGPVYLTGLGDALVRLPR